MVKPVVVLTDGDVPAEACLRLEDALSEAERRWVGRQARKAARAVGTSKYVRHQGGRECARRVSRMERA